MNEVIFPLAGKRIWVAGHTGMVGSALLRRLASEDCEILTVARKEVDLKEQAAVREWIARERPDVVFLAAATVGGIVANDSYPADFLYDNLMIEANVIEAAFRNGVKKLLMLGSSCIYPRLAPQPMAEDALLTGPLEATNQWYAIAKIAGVKLVQAYRRQYDSDFISAMPTNLYGTGDHYNLKTSHVVPALIHKAHIAKTRGDDALTIWGSGTPKREFLHVDDCADACVHLMKVYSGPDHVNVGSGSEQTIAQLARLVANIVGFKGEIVYDRSKPDGTPRKLMDSGRLRAMGWIPRIQLDQGLKLAYQDYLNRRVVP